MLPVFKTDKPIFTSSITAITKQNNIFVVLNFKRITVLTEYTLW